VASHALCTVSSFTAPSTAQSIIVSHIGLPHPPLLHVLLQRISSSSVPLGVELLAQPACGFGCSAGACLFFVSSCPFCVAILSYPDISICCHVPQSSSCIGKAVTDLTSAASAASLLGSPRAGAALSPPSVCGGPPTLCFTEAGGRDVVL
jgi:hypothetical protein